tara:strand:- start:683 stop:910 length:228 start_codon:yes stop_codon:yes gene_type:complete
MYKKRTYSIGGDLIPYVNSQGMTVPGMYAMGGGPGAPSIYQNWNMQRKDRKRRRQWDKGKRNSSTYEGNLAWFQN